MKSVFAENGRFSLEEAKEMRKFGKIETWQNCWGH